jgi:pantoate--beta-alanine ligase
MLFMPSAEDIYSRGLEQQTFVEVPGFSYMICGASRPGHFRGVATIVCKLFNMVQPNQAYFGEKDFQQLQVIRTMVQDLSMAVNVHGVPTERESSGLAMSSRNGYLSEKEKDTARSLYKEMQQAKALIEEGQLSFADIEKSMVENLEARGFKNDYVRIVNATTLQPATSADKHIAIVAALFMGSTRLIDNLHVER